MGIFLKIAVFFENRDFRHLWGFPLSFWRFFCQKSPTFRPSAEKWRGSGKPAAILHSQNRQKATDSKPLRRFCIRKIARIFASQKFANLRAKRADLRIFAKRKFAILWSVQRPKSSILAVLIGFPPVVKNGQNRRFWPLYRSTFAQNFVPKFCAKVCTGHGHFSF